ncbi:MAG: hypothetical protein K2J80_05110 [Oscillospiraceae bacterium]|nr:hypothetical protein [Oscillospiraceae bacterium]
MRKRLICLIISAASVVLAYGKPVEIRGYLSVVLWLATVLFTVICAKNSAKFFRAAFIAVLVCYFISSGLFFLRNHGSVKIVHTERSGSTYIEYCDLNPGAMGSVHCRRTEYHCVVKSCALSILLPKSVKVFNGFYNDIVG